MYPLKFIPIHKPKIWGSETWLLSGYGDEISVVENGLLRGNGLDEVLEIYMDELVGQHVFDSFGNAFPLLFKYINAQDKLSVQVHPNDEQAAPFDSDGKSEMWYVTKAAVHAQIVVGFKSKVTQQQVQHAVDTQTLHEIVNYVPVSQGDVAYIPAGTVHALCGGSEVLEIQQSSDLTYRLYDYGRCDAEGNLRELHVEKALSVLNCNRMLQLLVDYEPQEDDVTRLVTDPHFTTNMLCISAPVSRDYASIDSFVVLMAAEGAFSVAEPGEEEVQCQQGELVLLPAAMTEVVIRPQGDSKILEIYVP